MTKTPWLFNPSTKHYISYDDPQSLDIKVQHALCEDLAGVMVWYAFLLKIKIQISDF